MIEQSKRTAKEAKTEMEAMIASLIQSFEEETGFQVKSDSIGIGRYFSCEENSKPIIEVSLSIS